MHSLVCFAKIRKAVEAFKTDNKMMYIQQKVALGGRDMGLNALF
jgi:ribosomal protein S6--L-glutamate ligase